MQEHGKTGVLDLIKRWLWTEVPHPGGDIVTCVVCACASLIGAIACYALFVFGGLGEMACFFMALGVVMLVGQIPKQVFRAYALTTMDAGGKVYRGRQIAIYALVGTISYAPWLVPAYGVVRAFYEINYKCVIKDCDTYFDYIPDSYLREQLNSRVRLRQFKLGRAGNKSKTRKPQRVSLIDYYENLQTMNWFSLSTYKKVYSLHFDGEPHEDKQYTQAQMKDAQLSKDISAALKKNDYEEASHLIKQISDDDLQSALNEVVSSAKQRKMDDEIKEMINRKFKNINIPES